MKHCDFPNRHVSLLEAFLSLKNRPRVDVFESNPSHQSRGRCSKTLVNPNWLWWNLMESRGVLRIISLELGIALGSVGQPSGYVKIAIENGHL